jgi:PAS domain S-box-containing protein
MSCFSLSSLRSRLLLLVLLAVIPALGLTLYTASEDRQREANHIREDALRLAQIVSVEEEQLIRGTRQLLVTLAELPQVVREGDPAMCSAFFADLLKQYHRYDNLGAIELDGDVFCSALPTAGPINAADRGYFQRALQTRDFAIGDYQIGRITGKPSINFGYPVLDEDGQVQAVVFAALDLDWLNQREYEVTAQLPQGLTLTKIDRDGVVLVHEPDPEKWVGQPALETPLAQTVLAQGQGVVEAVGLDGVPGVYAFAPVSSRLYARDMYVIIGIPEDVAFAEVNRVLARNLAGLGLVAVLALAAAWAFGDVFILRQVNALLQATKRLNGGDLGARTALPPAQGELGQLARAFDQMAEALEQRAAERKRAEEALRRREREIRVIAENVPALFSYVDADGCYRFVNKRYEEWFGVPRTEIVGKHYRQVLGEATYEQIKDRVEAALSGQQVCYEDALPYARAGTRWVFVNYVPDVDDRGKVNGFFALVTDITERKRAEEALRESEERYRSLFEGAEDHIFVLDQDFRYVMVNPSALKAGGFTLGDVVGKGPRETFPEDAEFYLSQYRQVFEAGEPVGFERELRLPDGAHWFSVTLSPIKDARGRVIALTGISRDITERKQAGEALRESEKRYRQLVETSPDAIFVHSDRKFVFVNPATIEIFGAANPEELIGRPIRDIIHPDYWKIIEERDQHIEQSEEGVGLLEEKLSRLDGTPIYVEAAGTSFTYQGKPAVQVCVRDITERKRAEEALRQYVERLGILCETDQAILAAQSPQAIAQAALSRITQLVPCQRVGITLFDLEAHQLTVLAAHFTGESRVPAGAHFSLEWFGADIERLRQGKVQVVEDVLALPQPARGLQILQAEGLRSATCVPLISRGELIGSLNLVLDSPGGLAPEYVDIAREVADSLAVAIQNALLLEQVHAGRERLQTLSRRLMEVQEVERRHIARELHDEIGQALTVMKINLQAVQRLLDTPALAPYLEESIRTVDRTLQQVRNLSLDLRPSLLDDLGLVPALRWYVDRQAQQAEFSAQFAADPLEKRLPPDLEIVCFRIVQEALTNVTRHAQARQVGVELRQRGDELQLVVRDDGVGFDVQTTLNRAAHGASMGLLGMEERALPLGGQVEIKSAPGRGTEIRARFPLTLAPSPEEGDEKGDSP